MRELFFETGNTVEGRGDRRIISSFLEILLQGAFETSTWVQMPRKQLDIWNGSWRERLGLQIGISSI